MAQIWKQRLYAFLLRRILDPFLEESSVRQLHDTLEVSLQEGKFVLRDVRLDCSYISDLIEPNCPGLVITNARIDRFEINLRLQENNPAPSPHSTTSRASSEANGLSSSPSPSSASSSSLAWRALKLGTTATTNESMFPAVSLIAEIILDGIFIEIEPVPYYQRRRRPRPTQTTRTSEQHNGERRRFSSDGRISETAETQSSSSSSSSSKSVIGNYIEAALKSLQLNLKINGLEIKLYKWKNQDHEHEHEQKQFAGTSSSTRCQSWMTVRLSSFVYNESTSESNNGSSRIVTAERSSSRKDGSSASLPTRCKTVDISDILVQIGSSTTSSSPISNGSESNNNNNETSNIAESTIALIQGTGRALYRIVGGNDSNNNSNFDSSSQYHDVEVKLNHQVNVSMDCDTIIRLENVLNCYTDVSQPNYGEIVDHTAREAQHIESLKDNISPYFRQQHADDPDADVEDLKVLTGILSQYKDAYILAENNQLRGGILVPKNAYLDEAQLAVVEDMGEDDDTTFDVFFDANDQSFYNTASAIQQSMIGNDNQESNDNDQVKSKISIHLESSCLKLIFRDDPDGIDGIRYPFLNTADEYILVSINDVNIEMTSRQKTSEVILTIMHFEIEDAYRTIPSHPATSYTTSVGGRMVVENSFAVEIGSLLTFRSDDSVNRGSNENNAFMVSQPPAFRISLKSEKAWKQEGYSESSCDISLLPIHLIYRQRTFGNLSAFHTCLSKKRNTSQSNDPTFNGTSDENLSKRKDRPERFVLVVDCPSVTVFLPVGSKVPMTKLFNREHEEFHDAEVRENALGISLECLSIQYDSSTANEIEECKGGETNGKGDVDINLTTDAIFLFALGSEKSQSGFHCRMLRRDFFAIGGRNEVIPQIPVTFQYIKFGKEKSHESRCRDHFPVVPSISSFKARQEDDDEEEMTIPKNSSLSSFPGSTPSSRQFIRSVDPQASMISDVEGSSSLVSITIPQILADVTNDELSTLFLVMSSISQTNAQPSSSSSEDMKGPMDTESHFANSPQESDGEAISVAINCDEILLSAREDPSGLSPGATIFATHLTISTFKSHILLCGSGLKHCRVMTHDLCAFASYGQGRQAEMSSFFDATKVANTRLLRLRRNVLRRGEISITPIVYRSQMFTPISQESPSILLDYIDTSFRNQKTLSSAVLKQRCIHLTLYHLTGRVLVDSDWPERLKNLIPSTEESDECTSESSIDSTSNKSGDTMTKIFVTGSDVNIDYLTPDYFNTQSRSIVRLNDCRLTCSLLSPASIVQAFSFSVGDVNYDIGAPLPYDNEDACLCGAGLLMLNHSSQTEQYSKKSVFGSMHEAVLRELAFVNVLSLDSLTAVIMLKDPDRDNAADQQRILDVLLTFGTLSVTACKDSFECLASSLSELQIKLTGVTDEELQKMRNDQGEELPINIGNCDLPSLSVASEDYSEFVRGSSTDFRKGGSKYGSYLLDGYAWTSIDHDESIAPETEIPEGKDEVAFWYSHNNRLPGQVIQHHFSLRATADPLADGDMGAQAYAGKDSIVRLKARLVVQKLNLKLRLFDGYDWPEKCNDMERDAAARQGRNFVIEPMPPSVLAERKKAVDEQAASVLDQKEKEALIRRAKLMGDLLDNKDPVTFKDTPLPQARFATISNQSMSRMCARQLNTFLQVSINGVSCRMDAYQNSSSHRLQSVLELAVSKLFVAETVSHAKHPVKMLGDWIDDSDHPRDTRFGSLMVKMATWRPVTRISPSYEIKSDDCEVTMQLLPMRCLLDQRAIAFARSFFNKKRSEDDDLDDEKKNSASKSFWFDDLHIAPSPRFRLFKVKPWKLKVDYLPKKIDINALREGSVVELVNVSPIRRMVITLSEVNVVDSDGGGPAFSQIVSSWVKEICATQLHKFLANAQPLEPLTDVGQGLSDLVVLPYEAYKNGDSVRRAVSKGFTNLAETVAFQTFNTASDMTKYAADIMAEVLSQNLAVNILPRGSNAATSLAAGFQAAKVVVVNQDYRRGVTGALTSVASGIPVLLVAPLTGVSDAASHTFRGARNVIRPSVRRDEEDASIMVLD